jgi:hypothetical protein
MHLEVQGAIDAALARYIIKGPKGPLQSLGQNLVNQARQQLSKYARSKLGGIGGMDLGSPITGGMYSKSELAKLWVQAGGPPGVANIMAAIALAESGGNPTIQGPVTSYGFRAGGLWQIHPPQPGWQNPLKNARMAVAKYKAGGFQPWEAYTDGSYSQFLKQGGIVQMLAEGGMVDLNRLPMPFRRLTSQDGDTRQKAAKEILKAVTGHDLSPAALKQLGALTGEAALFEELGGRAGAIGEGGSEVAYLGEKLNEAGWLDKALGRLFNLRNSLILGDDAVEGYQIKVGELLKRATDALKEFKDLVKDIENAITIRREYDEARKDLDAELAKPPNQQNQGKIQRLSDKVRQKHKKLKEIGAADKTVADLVDLQKRVTLGRDKLGGNILTGMKDHQTKLVDLRGSLLSTGGEGPGGVFDSLESVQGLAALSGVEEAVAPLKDFKYGSFGGRIFDLQSRLQDLAAAGAEIADGGAGAADEFKGISIAQLREFAEAVRYGAFDTDPYGTGLNANNFAGFFAGGGDIPAGMFGIAGEKGPELIHGPSHVEPLTGGGTYAFVVENWETGTGHFKKIADDQIHTSGGELHASYRAGRKR